MKRCEHVVKANGGHIRYYVIMTDVFSLLFANIWYCDKLLSDILHCWKLKVAHFCNFLFYTYVYILLFVTSLNQPITIKFYTDT